ncbi:MAG: hypothetical protein OS112_01670 [Methanoregula sp.]|nr:MAG: hypothetical protein OS112_01670 [Methanoregula sp.]
MTAQNRKPYGWRGTIHDLLLVPRQEWRNALDRHYAARMNHPADDRVSALWEQAFDVFKKELKQLVQVKPELEHYTIIFEYEVPHSSARGPDIVILGSSVFILEFVDCDEIFQAHVDATCAYASDVGQYHRKPLKAEIIPVLVCARAKGVIRRVGDVVVLSPDHIGDFLNVQAELETDLPIDADEWLSGRT